ncbi:hypothetical protein F4776DRAFT_648604 [Hypoxylon sp. NC0597]|nr:hypothetical protein F4776DRAFT_648604 [Hypoxylon sp. NC0597]
MFGDPRAIVHTTPRGTCSRIISLRLRQHFRATSHINRDSFPPCQNIHPFIRGLATASQSTNPILDREFAVFRSLLVNRIPEYKTSSHGAVSVNRSLDTAGTHAAKTSINDLVKQFPSPFQKLFEALQQRDTRRLLIYLRRIPLMGELKLQEAVARLPRTTFTELLRSLDPLCVARDADPTDQANIPVGMYQTLHLDPYIDEWGIRKLYSQLLQGMLALVAALKASGQVLQTEEYIYLLRCAGAASDPVGANWIWNDMVRDQTVHWRQGETYAEYISARFLTRPLYTGYDKTRRLVHPRNLHRSRIRLDSRHVERLDRLRFNTRLARLCVGLLKDVPHTEDIMRKLRKNRPVTKLFFRLLQENYILNESLLCSFMIAFGRAGSLRFIGSRILHAFFGIDLRRLTYHEGQDTQITSDKNQIESFAYRVRPTVRLMEAVVEVYGSNAEIAIAFQLVNHISKTYHIPIPRSVWQDLLEWTLVMGSPSMSVAWKQADMQFKIPTRSAVELIWDAMVSHQVQPGFDQYSILIRSLLGRHQISRVLPFMRQAIELYKAQVQEYEEAVFEYVRMVQDGLRLSNTVHRYERARFQKSRMWYEIRAWCRKYLSVVRSFDPHNPLTIVAVPNFIRDFRHFIPTPAQYRTATGYISLHDPAQEQTYGVRIQHLPMFIPTKSKRKRTWGHQYAKVRKLSILSRNSLAGHAPISKLGLVTLLTSTARTLRPYNETPELEDEHYKDFESLQSLYEVDDYL